MEVDSASEDAHTHIERGPERATALARKAPIETEIRVAARVTFIIE